MNFFFNATGQLIMPPDEDVYQGSINAAKIYFIAPVSLANNVSVGFTLPNGYVTYRTFMSVVSGTGIVGMQTIKGVTFNMWTATLGQDITAYAGNVNVQFFITNGNNQTLATFTANFTVQGGTMSPLPSDMPSSPDTVWQSFLTAYNATGARITAAESIATEAKNTAEDAATAAEGAVTYTEQALKVADRAEDNSITAKTNASQAVDKADEAKAAAQTADNKATAAYDKADEAYDKADDAQTAATNAQTAAGNAVEAVNGIQELIPTKASAENQLADKSFVNSSIATNTANFIGTFTSVAAMLAYSGTVTNNDYAFVVTTNGDMVEKYDRYKYNANATNTAPNAGKLSGTHWFFEFTLNNSSFTSAQWAAINSGITALNKVVQSDLSVTPTSGKAAKFNSSGNLETGTATQSGEAVNLGQLNSAIADVATSVVNVSGTSFTSAMAKNRVYSASTLTRIAPTSSGFTGITADYVAELHFTAGASLTVSLPSNAEYAVGEPIYETGKQYILYFVAKPDLTGVWVFWATNGTLTTIEYATKQELNNAISLVTRQIPTVSKTGTTAPTSSTVADFVGQFYLDTVTPKTYQCTAISSGVYTWAEVGGGGGGSTPIYKHKLHITVNGSKVQEIWGHYYSTDENAYTPEEFAEDGDKKFDVDYLKCDSTDGKLYANGGKISTSNQASIGAVQFTIQNAVFVLDDHSSLNLRTTYQSYMFGYPDYGTFVEAIDVDDTVEEI